jgi:hypothetical protein
VTVVERVVEGIEGGTAGTIRVTGKIILLVAPTIQGYVWQRGLQGGSNMSSQTYEFDAKYEQPQAQGTGDSCC